MVLMILPFERTPLWVLICFLGAIGAMEEVFFLGRFWLEREGDLEYGLRSQ